MKIKFNPSVFADAKVLSAVEQSNLKGGTRVHQRPSQGTPQQEKYQIRNLFWF